MPEAAKLQRDSSEREQKTSSHLSREEIFETANSHLIAEQKSIASN
jgi:hypothetical protein